MSIRTGVIVSVTFKKVDDAPDSEACADGGHEGLEDRNTAAEKSHNVPFPFCFAQNKRSSRIDPGKPLPNGSIFSCSFRACLL